MFEIHYKQDCHNAIGWNVRAVHKVHLGAIGAIGASMSCIFESTLRSNCVHIDRWSCSTIVFLLVEGSCDLGRTFQYATILLARSRINIDTNYHCGVDPKCMANGFAGK